MLDGRGAAGTAGGNGDLQILVAVHNFFVCLLMQSFWVHLSHVG